MRNYISKGLIWLVSIFLLSCGGSSSVQVVSQCLIDANKVSRVILGGTPCQSEQSSIARIEIKTSSETVFCSGYLSEPNIVRTAAHCLIDAEQISIYFPSEQWNAAQWSINESFRRDDQVGAFFNDTAQITLPSPSTLTPLTSASSNEVSIDSLLRVYGYGTDGILKEALVTISEITPTHIFVKSTGSGDICFGDSGGPAIKEEDGKLLVVGVVSSGFSRSCQNNETLITR